MVMSKREDDFPRKDGITTMDENTQAKFDEKVKELLNSAKKKKNVLEYQEISDFFADMPLEEEQFEKILEVLEQNNVDVLRITDDDADVEEIILTDEDEVDVENLDLTIPDGISLEDPVRMYLKEIGKVPLLSADEAKLICKHWNRRGCAKAAYPRLFIVSSSR